MAVVTLGAYRIIADSWLEGTANLRVRIAALFAYEHELPHDRSADCYFCRVLDIGGEDHWLALWLCRGARPSRDDAAYRGAGRRRSTQAMMGPVVYGYATGVFSVASRIGRRMNGGVSCSLRPTIIPITTRWRLPPAFLKAIEGLFVQVLLCAQTGLLKMGTIALDGTKIKANASRHKAITYEHGEECGATQGRGRRFDGQGRGGGRGGPDGLRCRDKERREEPAQIAGSPTRRGARRERQGANWRT